MILCANYKAGDEILNVLGESCVIVKIVDKHHKKRHRHALVYVRYPNHSEVCCGYDTAFFPMPYVRNDDALAKVKP